MYPCLGVNVKLHCLEEYNKTIEFNSEKYQAMEI